MSTLPTYTPHNYTGSDRVGIFVPDPRQENGAIEVCSTSTHRAPMILAALNRPIFAYQIHAADNDSNGNPRRATVVYAPNGSIAAVMDHGYSGDRIPRDAVTLARVDVTPRAYREIVAHGADLDAARKYLAAHPDGVTGWAWADVDDGPERWRTFRQRAKALGLNPKRLSEIASQVCVVLELRSNGYDWTGPGVAS